MPKAQTGSESRLAVGLQSAGRKADFLNQYNVYYGDPLAYRREMARLLAVTPADVRRVANRYLTAGRVRLDAAPGPPTPRAPEVEVDRSAQGDLAAPTPPQVKDTFDRGVMPTPGPT